jgi:acyl carrier protein phosphodiesterase
MNFLAHLWLADRTQTSLAGSVLGDVVRGADLSAYPEDIALGIRLHRRVDAATDRHPVMQRLREGFGQGERRYAGIVLDLAADHALAQQWSARHAEPLPAFAQRCGVDIDAADRWFIRGGAGPLRAVPFAELLCSYATDAGIECAIRRTSTRLRDPQGLIDAGRQWLAMSRALQPALGELLDSLLAVMRAQR